MAASTIQIIDTHVHVLQPSRFHYHWLKPGSHLDRDFDLSDLCDEMKELNVIGGVLVEATNTAEEIPWLLDMCATGSRQWGVIGWINLEQPDAAECITYFVCDPNFKGVRLNWLEARSQTSTLNAAMTAIRKNRLVVDVLARWEFLSEVLAFMHQYPDVSFVLEHLGGVVATSLMLDMWQKMMKQFAALPNVAVKISGYNNLLKEPSAETTLRDYVKTADEFFGNHRLMFGSNYPMFMNSTTYTAIFRQLYDATEALGQSLQTALFYETAREIYNLTL